MTTTYFKAVRPDGTDFHTGTVQWAPPEGHEGEWIVRHPAATEIGDDASGYLSVATVATDCTAMSWPCRLLTVEAIGDVTIPSPSDLPSKRAGVAFRVTGELPAHEALGSQGEAAAALIDRARRLTADELDSLAAAWDAAWDAAWAAARDAARDAAWAAARDAARYAAWYAVLATLVRDVIAPEQYEHLMAPVEAARAVMCETDSTTPARSDR